MATIDEMNSSMTIFYSKSTGLIKSIMNGIQDMNFFGQDKEDFTLIWDFIVLNRDDYVLNNYKQFKINLDSKALELIASALPNYPVAQE